MKNRQTMDLQKLSGDQNKKSKMKMGFALDMKENGNYNNNCFIYLYIL